MKQLTQYWKNKMSHSHNLSRRRLLQTGAALTILPALVPSVFGKAPIAGSQVISVHRMQLGAFEITSMLDGYIDIPPAVLQADPSMVKTMAFCQFPYLNQ